MADRFDFVVVGAGSAGCVLANRLSGGGRYSGCLLEAGPAGRFMWIHIPIGYGKTMFHPVYNWGFYTDPDPNMHNRRLYWPRGRTLVSVPLMDEEFVLVTSPAWARRIGPVDCDDPGPLRGVPLVAYAEDLPILRRYWRHVFRTRLTARPAFVVPDLRGVLAAVTAGAGITVLPRYLCETELASGALVPLLTPDDPPINTGFLVERAGAPSRAPVTAVREQLLTAARSW